jgi:uncharacterized membrane protein YukC
MGNDDSVVQLLTEIRDNQRNQIEAQKKALADAARVQQRLVRTVTITLRILVILLSAFLVVVGWSIVAR